MAQQSYSTVPKEAAYQRNDVVGPGGSATWSMGPGGFFQQNIKYDPNLQYQFDRQQLVGANAANLSNELFGYAAQNMKNGFDPSAAGPMAGPVSAGSWDSWSPSANQNGIQMNVASAGNAQRNIPNVGDSMTRLNLSGVNAVDPSSFDVNAYAERAYAPLADILNRQYDRSGDALDARLAAQGLTLGSEGYREAQNIQNEGRHDALVRALSQSYGLGLDASQIDFGQSLAANQNAFNQAMGQGQFYNQGLNDTFGRNLSAGQFYNQGLNQDQSRNLALGQFANSAQNQRFQQGYSLDNLDLQGRGQDLSARSQDIGLGQFNANLQNENRQQSLQEMLTARQLPMQDIAYLQSLYAPYPQFSLPGTGGAGQQQPSQQQQLGQALLNFGGNVLGSPGLWS